MDRRNNIAIYFFILLLAFFSNAGNGYIHSFNNAEHAGSVFVRGKEQRPYLDLKKPVIKNDWVKVRYMGGECRYDASVFCIVISSPGYIDHFKEAGYTSGISSYTHFLFKLRGPPTLHV
jgi:hypothetical protein